jgi:RsiW-degrading membrane proteinase PrsW (M82 family)
MKCSHCNHDVPDGAFCTVCGAHEAATKQAGNAAKRVSHYAAYPGEHVFHPGIFTTLFPHLGQHKVHEFRWAFLAGIAAVFVLDVAGMVSAAILTAAMLIPVLYLIYLYEAQVYRDAPATSLGFTIGGGVILGIVVTVIVDHFTNSSRLGGPVGSETGTLVSLCIIVPIVQELLKPLPALLLRETSDFQETVDGLVFGVAAGLGFGVAETIIRFSSVLGNLDTRTDPGNWIYPLLTIAITLPLLQGSATGAITAAVWRMRKGAGVLRDLGAVGMAIVAHIGFVYVSQLMSDRGQSQLVILAWQGAVDGALLMFVRYILHHALLDEAHHFGFAETVCPNCHRQIVAAAFCHNCGRALAASAAPIAAAQEPVAGTASAEA